MSPLVAIVTPVYNGAKYLAETMASVQAQTYPNLVHVVLDNNSADATPEIIKAYQNGRVRVITARNPETLALYPNWNHALSLMPTDTAYFRILCADDLITPDATEKMVSIFARDAAVGTVAAAERRGEKVWDFGWEEGDVFDGKEKIAAYYRDQLALPAIHCMFRYSAYTQRAPEFFDQRLRYADMDTLLSVMREGKIGFVHDAVAITREHEDSMTSTTTDIDKMHFPDWLIKLRRYGPEALGPQETAALERRFKRYYFRRMLRWRLKDKNVELVDRHLKQLALIDAAPSLADYGDALLDWGMVKLGLRPQWARYPY